MNINACGMEWNGIKYDQATLRKLFSGNDNKMIIDCAIWIKNKMILPKL